MNWILMENKYFLFLLLFLFACRSQSVNKQILHDEQNKIITLCTQEGKLKMEISYANGCFIRKLDVDSKTTLSPQGVYTGVTTKTDTISSRQLNGLPKVEIQDKLVRITEIMFGSDSLMLEENWEFKLDSSTITWSISRTFNQDFIAEDAAFPQWNFADLVTWKGGILDNGGVVWCKYLRSINDTYGVHTGGTKFWNDSTGNGLSIQGTGIGNTEIATKFSQGENGVFTSTNLVTEKALKQRHHLSRMVHGKFDVFAPFQVSKGEISASYILSYFNYAEEFNRGDLKSIPAEAVRELLNTTARYGVVDNGIVGANGWLTNWKCMHEPFFAQIAVGVMDSNYTRNLANTLDQERDLAMLPDGRVLSRWHNERGDEIPGTYNDSTGYYEAMWGYTIDSQTGYVLNVTELFDLTGDRTWLMAHQASCEKALEWLLKRDENRNGIYEMMNRTTGEGKASDWIDIVWASYENTFVNAQLYSALRKWAACELLLNNKTAADSYQSIAAKLKDSFNRPVQEGGFWSPEKHQYIYWRDADGSIHGDNLVTPVNFMAIASGICDDSTRVQIILDQIERRTSAENLFHWPLCFDSFKREEVHENNWPFPTYENGDIFPSWGGIGIRSYVQYDRQLALKYIKNLLKQYQIDGLSSQRYSRKTQKGLGSDILAGISTGVVALYSDIYGIQPRWNRFVLNPAMVSELNGTNFDYILRGEKYHVVLNESNYQLSTKDCSVQANQTFGLACKPGELQFFPGDQDISYLKVNKEDKQPIRIVVHKSDSAAIEFTLQETGRYKIQFGNLTKDTLVDKNTRLKLSW
ncbi:hypothetical protein [Flavihumibacter sp. UBA7668]|uniref:hypothetical protein n=1 Tax=Flavihumibacter sp. UBA7668 TaxID=1946542 RepID=UPI0025BFDA00|nr:hypothetical protein [Flavihumibacter sp. UBA7668]